VTTGPQGKLYVGVYTSDAATTLVDAETLYGDLITAQSDSGYGAGIALSSSGTEATVSFQCASASSCSTSAYVTSALTIGSSASPTSAAALATGTSDYFYAVTTAALTQPTFYISVYLDSTCSEAAYIQEDSFVVNAAAKALTSADSTSLHGALEFTGVEFKGWYGSSSTPSGGDLAGVVLTLDSDNCVAGTTFYYSLTTATTGYTAPTKLYVAYYSAADCPTADFVGEDQFTIQTTGVTTTTALTSVSTLFGEVTYSFPTITIYDRCTSDN